MIRRLRRRWLELVVVGLVGLCTLGVILALGGCATTTIETPIGTYTSNRDSQLDELRIEIIETPEGGKTTIVEVGGASGRASSVIEAQTDLLRAAIEAAFAAGLRAAPGG